MIPDLVSKYSLKDPYDVIKYQDLSVQGRKFCESYSDYWNSSVGDDGKFVNVD
jgi:hypothetical protein